MGNEGDIDEAAILRDAIAGGESARAAFGHLWSAYYRRLALFAATFRGLPVSEREDAVSDALIDAFRGLARHDARYSLNAWVYGVARRQFAEKARKALRESARFGGTPEDRELRAPDDTALGVEADDEARRCRLALEGLPEDDRRIAILRFQEGMDATSIGDALDIPAGTVRWRVHVIRRLLRERVEAIR